MAGSGVAIHYLTYGGVWVTILFGQVEFFCVEKGQGGASAGLYQKREWNSLAMKSLRQLC